MPFVLTFHHLISFIISTCKLFTSSPTKCHIIFPLAFNLNMRAIHVIPTKSNSSRSPQIRAPTFDLRSPQIRAPNFDLRAPPTLEGFFFCIYSNSPQIHSSRHWHMETTRPSAISTMGTREEGGRSTGDGMLRARSIEDCTGRGATAGSIASGDGTSNGRRAALGRASPGESPRGRGIGGRSESQDKKRHWKKILSRELLCTLGD